MVAWRQREWRQAQGLFSEIFPSRAYLRKSFEKGLKSKKDGSLAHHHHSFSTGERGIFI
jgi:hypothetical protein